MSQPIFFYTAGSNIIFSRVQDMFNSLQLAELQRVINTQQKKNSPDVTVNVDIISSVFYEINNTAYCRMTLKNGEVIWFLATDSEKINRRLKDKKLLAKLEESAVNDNIILPSIHRENEVSPIFSKTLLNSFDDWNKEVKQGSGREDFPWSLNGQPYENAIIKTRNTPLSKGLKNSVWEAISDGKKGSDGGFISPSFPVDESKTYRFCTYIKKLDSEDGRTYHGLYGLNAKGTNHGVIVRSSSSSTTNPYFWSGDLTRLNQWYLLVGFVFPSTSKANKIIEGGIWEVGVDGRRRKANYDFMWKKGTTQAKLRDYLYYVKDKEIRQQFFLPRVEEVNGLEMPIELLINARK